MSEIVNALTCVHDKIEVQSQWKRAVEALRCMSHMQIAVAWVDLSTYAMKIGDERVHSQYKTLFQRALKEAEAHKYNADAVPIIGKSLSDHKLNQLIATLNEVKELILIRNRINTPALSDVMSDGDTTLYSSSSNTSRPSPPSSNEHEAPHPLESHNSHEAPPRPQSAPSGIRADGVMSPAQGTEGQFSLNAWKDILKKCCSENRLSSAKIEQAVETLEKDIINIKEGQLKFTASSNAHYVEMTDYMQKQDSVVAKLDSMAAQLETVTQKSQQLIDRPDHCTEFDDRMSRIEAANHSHTEQSMALIQAKIVEIMQGRFDDIEGKLINEFQQQTDAIMNRESGTVCVVEKTEETLKTILEILQSHESSTQKSSEDKDKQLTEIKAMITSTNTNTADLKKTVAQKIEAMTEHHKTSTTTLTAAVKDALDLISKMLQTLLELHQKKKTNSIEHDITDGNTTDGPLVHAGPDISGDASDEDGVDTNGDADSVDGRAKTNAPDPAMVSVHSLASGTNRTKKAQAITTSTKRGKNRDLLRNENPLAANPRSGKGGTVSNAVESSGRTFVPGKASDK